MINYKKTILLTGAGFSKNFGGYLASEIWSKIFNNPDLEKLPLIKEKLRSNFDFESIYAEVLDNKDFSLKEKNDFQNIIIKAYVDMDDMLGQYSFTEQNTFQINIYGIREMLGLFAGSKPNEIGLHFTLNQDLFMERKINRPALGLELLDYKHYRDAISSGRIDSSVRVNLPNHSFINNFKQNHLNSSGDLFYIKLHGSLGWYSAIAGNKKMVLGNNKLSDIMEEPLLKWYFEIFKEALLRDNVRFFIIGYGFNDKHINQVIAEAVIKHNLKIYIISPENPQYFRERLIHLPFSNKSTLRKFDKQGIEI